MKVIAGTLVLTTTSGLLAWFVHRRRNGQAGIQILEAIQPVEIIQDLETLVKVCHDPRSLAWVGTAVRSLSVSNAGSQLGHLHPTVGHMTSLQHLDLSGSAVHHLPHFISQLTSLQELRMSRCQLNHICLDIAGCQALTSLDLSYNGLIKVPDALCQLVSLQKLNLMGNRLPDLPESFGNLTNLSLLGLKSNQLTRLPDSFTRLTSLVELFITDNKLTTLPTGFGALKSLVKLQASFNLFTHLPADLLNLPNLELMRVAVCQLTALPAGLHDTQSQTAAALPKLAWFSLSGNEACAALPAPRADLATWSTADVVVQGDVGAKLGDGASGEVFKAVLAATGETVAVKQFRADVSPDGRTEEEVGIACALSHPHLTHVLGIIPSEEGANAPPLLIMKLVKGQPMAAKPTSKHLLRCKWDPEVQFMLPHSLQLLSGVASALAYMHSMNICHGDVYAHNILLDSHTWHTTLCDFGASFVYKPSERFWQAMEVRAYGLFLKDVVDRTVGASSETAAALAALVEGCTREPWTARPSFADITQTLSSM